MLKMLVLKMLMLKYKNKIILNNNNNINNAIIRTIII